MCEKESGESVEESKKVIECDNKICRNYRAMDDTNCELFNCVKACHIWRDRKGFKSE